MPEKNVLLTPRKLTVSHINMNQFEDVPPLRLKDKEKIPANSITFLLRMVMELKYYAEEVIGHHYRERQSVKFLMF